jgi:hypothetical protein
MNFSKSYTSGWVQSRDVTRTGANDRVLPRPRIARSAASTVRSLHSSRAGRNSLMARGPRPTHRPAEPDPMRIVPMSLPIEMTQPLFDLAAAPAPSPELTYRGGPLLTAAEVVTIFWGQAWSGQQAGTVDQMNGFFDFVLTSPLLDQLAEYGVSGKAIGHGRRTGTVTITTPGPTLSITDAAIQAFLLDQLANNPALPKADPNSLYFVFLPSGVKVTQGGTQSCQSFCGYHDATSGQVFYAVMPYPDCAGCRGGAAVFDALTTTVSHELCEAITDPIPGQGWYDDANGEIGDICAWKTKKLGQYTVQLEWSNAQRDCA